MICTYPSKSIWMDQNQFGPIKEQGVSLTQNSQSESGDSISFIEKSDQGVKSGESVFQVLFEFQNFPPQKSFSNELAILWTGW